jgi:hypothetical protein
MAIDLPFRRRAVRTLTSEIGCYILCDLDQVPIYVGQSVDGVHSRVNRPSGQEQNRNQLPRKHIVSRVSRTFRLMSGKVPKFPANNLTSLQ